MVRDAKSGSGTASATKSLPPSKPVNNKPTKLKFPPKKKDPVPPRKVTVEIVIHLNKVLRTVFHK